MKWSVISSPALLILYLVTFSSAEELKRKTPVQLKIKFTSILVCCIFEFPFFCTTLFFSTGILSHFYRHDLAYLSNVNVLYRPGFEVVVVLVFIRLFFLGKDQKIELVFFLLFMGTSDVLRVFIIAQAIGG